MNQALNNECIICIEPENCILVKKNTHCDCEYSVHKKCLDTWIQKQNKCIICRKVYDVKHDNMMLFIYCPEILLSYCVYTLMLCLIIGIIFVVFYIFAKTKHV